jgi:hypothetical protein
MKIHYNKVKKLNIYEQEKIQEEIKKTYNLLYVKLYQRNLTIDQSGKRILNKLSHNSPRDLSNSKHINNSIPNTDRTYHSNINHNLPGDHNNSILGKTLANSSKERKSLFNNGNTIETDLTEKLKHPNEKSSKIESPIFVPNIKTIKVDKNLMLKLNNQIREKNSNFTNLKLSQTKVKGEDDNLYNKENIPHKLRKNKSKEKYSIPSIDLNYYTPQKKTKKFIDFSSVINKKIHKQQDIPIDKSQNIYLSDYIYHVEKKFLKPTDEKISFNYFNRGTITESSNQIEMYRKDSDKNNDSSMDNDEGEELSNPLLDKKSKIPLNIYIEKGNQLKKKFV